MSPSEHELLDVFGFIPPESWDMAFGAGHTGAQNGAFLHAAGAGGFNIDPG